MHFWKISFKTGLKLKTNKWKENRWLMWWKQFSMFVVNETNQKTHDFHSKILNCIPKQCNKYWIVENEISRLLYYRTYILEILDNPIIHGWIFGQRRNVAIMIRCRWTSPKRVPSNKLRIYMKWLHVFP